jgi:hypothetical protein
LGPETLVQHSAAALIDGCGVNVALISRKPFFEMEKKSLPSVMAQ